VRQKREIRRAGRSIRLTERDEALLGALARFGMARTSQLRRLLFPRNHPDIFADRARRLFDAGYLDVASAGLSESNRYALGPRGMMWARNRNQPFVRPPRGGHEHWLAIVETWVQCARFAHESGGVALVSARPEWELRPTAVGPGVVPDLLIEIAAPAPAGSHTVRLAIEVDLATERATVLGRKLSAYRALLVAGDKLFGWSDFALGFAVRGWTEGRKQALSNRMDTTMPVPSVVWDLDAGLKDALSRLLEPRETPVAASRYCNGMDVPVSACVTSDIDQSRDGLSHE
jgi:hypothetical protein